MTEAAEESAEDLSDAAEDLADAAEDLAEATERSVPENPFAALTEVPGAIMPTSKAESALQANLEPIQTAVDETAESAASAANAAAANAENAKSNEETAEASLAAAEGTQESLENIVEDGFTFDDSQLDETLGEIGEMIPDRDEEPDYLKQLWDNITGLFSDKEDAEQKALSGIDSDMNKGFDSVAGGGAETESEYTLLDEYNELMQLWSGNKDANGEWIADWSEGGIGQTLADLIQGKMPGKYWGDLTEEDKRRMAGMTASDGYVKGQYETKFAPTEPVTIPADLEIVSIENGEGASEDVLDLDSLKEAVPEEAILSWQNLDAAFGSIMQTLNGGEGGLGLPAVLQSISDLVGTLPGQIDTLCGALTGSMPDAVSTALKFIGTAIRDESGNVQIGGGNTLMTSFGTVKVLFEDTNAAIDLFCKGLTDKIPPAVESFKKTCGTASSLLAGLYMWAGGAADQFFRLADGVDAAAGSLKKFRGGSSPDGGGEGSGIFAAAHGGQVRGVGVVGENGAEVISTTRNLNVFTNHALEIAQAKVADVMSKRSYASDARSPRLNKDDLLTAMQGGDASINVTIEGSIFGESWLQDYVVKTMTGQIRRELRLAN